MARSVVATAKRTVRRAATWRPKQDGRETLDIGALISPFRYDVVVRAQLFDAVAERPSGQSTQEFAQSVSDHAYAVWFREVELRRFFPWMLKDPAAVADAYATRVARAVSTFESFERHGFDRDQPIMLRSLPRPVASDSGVLVQRTLHLGDGGHRLALLHRSGAALEPWMHRIDPRATKVIDNTAILVPALGLDEATYAAFLAPAFGLDVASATSIEQLRLEIESRCPERLPELHALVAAHLQGVGSR